MGRPKAKRIEKVCKYCGRKFSVLPCKATTAIFCSRYCKDKANQQKTLQKGRCTNCGTEFFRARCRFKDIDNEFCSNECRLIYINKRNIELFQNKISLIQAKISELETQKRKREEAKNE